MPTREQWQAIIEQQLPPRTHYLARNRAITACYATWYLEEPWLFKWAGLAAFASEQVGVSLALFELIRSPNNLLRVAPLGPAEQNPVTSLYAQLLNLTLALPLALHDSVTRQLLLNDLELIKQANDAIFADIGWAHLAYARGGLRAVEPHFRLPEQAELRDAFRMLDEAVHLLGDPANYAAGCALMRQSAVVMIHHEQMGVLPPFLARMSDQGQIMASFGARLDFEGSPDLAAHSWFSGYFSPMDVVGRQRSMANSADRWAWIEHDLLPKWDRVDADYHEHGALHRRLRALATQEATPLHQLVTLVNQILPGDHTPLGV